MAKKLQIDSLDQKPSKTILNYVISKKSRKYILHQIKLNHIQGNLFLSLKPYLKSCQINKKFKKKTELRIMKMLMTMK